MQVGALSYASDEAGVKCLTSMEPRDGEQIQVSYYRWIMNE